MSRPRTDPLIRYEAKIDRSGGLDACHPWIGGTCRNGYGRLAISHRKTQNMIHRWAYQQRIRALKSTEVVRHTCDNPSCQNLTHLLVGTQGDNVRDAMSRGRLARGERRSTLKESQVLEIRSSLEPGNLLAQRYGVSPQAICDIRKGRKWQWLT